MSYSGGDGQTLGIILIRRHITELFFDFVDIKPSDKELDTCCGSYVIIGTKVKSLINQDFRLFLEKNLNLCIF